VPCDQDIVMDPSTAEVFSAPNDEEPEAHVLSAPRRSSRIAAKISELQKRRWETGHQKLTQEDEDTPDEAEGDGHTWNIGDAWNGEDDNDESEDEEDELMSATPGLEGISLWDILGEGFLKQVSELSMCNYRSTFVRRTKRSIRWTSIRRH
jgi:hypothetical protein